MIGRRSFLVTTLMAFGFAFLYIPILSMIVFSFNESRLVTVWAGFSTKWYVELFQNEQIISAARLSLRIAAVNATGAVILGTLAGFAAASNSYASGILAFPGAQTAWAQNDTLVYRFTLSVQDDNAAQGASSGLHTFTWEARNQ